MKNNLTLAIMSLLVILLSMIHLADDIFLGISPPGMANLIAAGVFAVLLYGTLTLAGRVSGFIVTLLGGILGAFIAWLHMRGGAGMLSPHVLQGGHVFRFVWTILALATVAVYTIILSVRALWSARATQPR